MKTEMSALDMRFVVKEMAKDLRGGIFRKIYQYKTPLGYRLLFEIYTTKGNLWLYADQNKIFLTNYKDEINHEPPNFCMFLRKHLKGQRIKDIKQNKFDRIVEIETSTNFLVFELFAKGNVILTDTYHNILMPMSIQNWVDREIRPKVGYKYPKSLVNPFELDFQEMKKTLSKQEKKIPASLAVTFGFGKEYANEILSICKVNAKKMTNELTSDDVENIYKVIQLLDKTEPQPIIYEDFVSPFPMKKSSSNVVKQTQTVSEAFDEYFSKMADEIVKEETENQLKKVEGKIEHIKKTQQASLEKWSEARDESKEIADFIYANYSTVSSVINGIKRSLDSGMKWQDIKQRVESEDSPEANAIKEIREDEGIIVLNLQGKAVEIEFNKTPEENAEKYYEESKKAKKKISGAEKAIVETEQKVLNSQKRPAPAPKKKVKRKRWYERYKWFFSSTNHLVIAGRDAKQNEQIVKKHAEPRDIMFHADIHGAAFVLIKAKDGPIDEITIKEASEFSAANSKAWSKNITLVDVFAFKPNQATKPSGALQPGSFVIQGQRVWFKDLEPKLSIGVMIDREKDDIKVIAGPVMAVRSKAEYFVTIRPGYKDSLELSRDVKNKLLQKCKPEDRYLIDQIPLNEFQIFIPSGKGELVEGVL